MTKEIEPAAPEPPKPHEQPLPENRSSIKMSWGMGTRKTPDPAPAAKKNSSNIVGRMPWAKNGGDSGAAETVNGSSSAPRRSKFGPPVSAGGAIPPPSLVTQAPTLVSSSEPASETPGHGNNFPPPPPMLAPPPAAANQMNQVCAEQPITPKYSLLLTNLMKAFNLIDNLPIMCPYFSY